MDITKVSTILVADYSPDTRFVLKCWLEMKGFRVIEATNGWHAIELS